MARIQTSGLGGNSGGSTTGNIDGGSANRVYLASQALNGGNAATTTFTAVLSGGNSTSIYVLG